MNDLTYNQQEAIKALCNRAVDARRLADELDNRVKSLTAGDSKVGFADQFNWAINDIENFIRNANFAELARQMSRVVD